ncbi:MAG TPA: hypothetical protein PKH79_08775 [Prolixibacteraceae bacterium]|nr:hypothetical protein [Prolixibacteraceae bacterium]
MLQQIIDPKELTVQNVWNLSEEDAFNMVQTLQTEYSKEDRSPYLKVIDSAFEFRTISSKRRDMKQSLSLLGFKFFKPQDNSGSTMITGVFKRRSLNTSFY